MRDPLPLRPCAPTHPRTPVSHNRPRLSSPPSREQPSTIFPRLFPAPPLPAARRPSRQLRRCSINMSIFWTRRCSINMSSQVGSRRKRCPGQFCGMGSIPATPSAKHASCFPPSSMPASTSIEISMKLIVTVCLSIFCLARLPSLSLSDPSSLRPLPAPPLCLPPPPPPRRCRTRSRSSSAAPSGGPSGGPACGTSAASPCPLPSSPPCGRCTAPRVSAE